MGKPPHPTPAQTAELQRHAGLQQLTSPTWAEVTADLTLHLQTTLPAESVALLQLRW